MKKKIFLLDNVISESQVRWYNSYWGLQPGESRYKIGKGTGLDQIFTAVFMRKGTRFCKKSLKLYLWIKQMKNSILINIRWRPQVLGYIRDINKKSFMSLVTFTFWGLQDRDLWLLLLLFLFHNGLLIGLTMGYLLL